MLKFVERQRGAISIFLLVIMVPMLMLASVMVDSARIRLGRSVAESAGDLTLNTALSQYDNVLKDMYGIFAVSQSKEELFQNLESYYSNSLKAAGLSDDAVTDYVGSIMKTLCSLDGQETGGKEGDLLRISVVDNSFTADRPKAGSLVNPALLKSQLINFMKYRAPIGFGMSFLSSLRSFSTLSDQMNVVEKRTEYYKEQQEVVGICEKAWKEIFQYNELKITEDYLEKQGRLIDNFANVYQFATRNAVMEYYNAKYGVNSCFDLKTLTYFHKTKSIEEFYYKGRKQTDLGKYNLDNPETNLAPLVSKLDEATQKYETMIQEEKNKKYQQITNNTYYKIQQTIQFTSDSFQDEGGSYAFVMKEVYLAYNKLKNAVKNLEDSITNCKDKIKGKKDKIDDINDQIDDLSKDVDGQGNEINHSDQISSLRSSIRSLEGEIKSLEDKKKKFEDSLNKVTFNGSEKTGSSWLSNYTSRYNSWIDTFEKMTDGRFSKVMGMYRIINIGKTTLKWPDAEFGTNNEEEIVNNDLTSGNISDQMLTDACKIISDLRVLLKKGQNHMKQASNYLQQIENKVKAGGKLSQKMGEWSDSTQNSLLQGDAMTEQNKQEIEAVKEFISEEEVRDLRLHVEEVEQTLKELVEEIDGYTFGGAKICEIANGGAYLAQEQVSAGIKKIKTLADKIIITCGDSYGSLKKPPLETAALEKMVSQIFKACYKEPYEEDFFKNQQFTCSWEEEPRKSPELLKSNGTDENGDDYNKFYVFLENNFKNTTDPGNQKRVEEQKKEAKEKQDALEGTAENQDKEFDNKKQSQGENISSESRPSIIWPSLKQEAINSNLAAGNPDSGTGNTPSIDSKSLDTDSAVSGSSNGLAALFSGLKGALSGMAVTLRDDIYLSSYIRGMFSFDTSESEALYNTMTESEHRDNLSVMQGKAAAGLNDKARKELQTLTQVPICPEYNSAYRNEVEYIIYGNEDNDTNRLLAYTSIFGIRFAFNTIYAITDNDIRNGANTIATVICQPPPFTLAQPVVKYAIIIGIAIAETSLDMLCLQAGMKVPLYKSEETWQMSFKNLWDNLTGTAKGIAAETVKGFVNKAVDKGEQTLQEWLNMGEQELNNIINGGAENASKKMEDFNAAVDKKMQQLIAKYAGTAMDQLTVLCQKANELVVTAGGGNLVVYGGSKIQKSEYVRRELNKWLGQGSNKDKPYMAKKTAVEYILNNQFITKVFSMLDGAKDNGSRESLIESMKKKMSAMQSELINACQDKFSQYIADAKNSLSKAASGGADALRKKLNDTLDQWATSEASSNGLASNAGSAVGAAPNAGSAVGAAPNAGSAVGAASFFSYQYSDYLQLFLMIGLIANQDGVLLRTADVIEANMKKQNEAFTMQNACTYVKIDATLQVQPLMMYLPFMKAVTESSLPGTDWYTISYHGMQGYN